MNVWFARVAVIIGLAVMLMAEVSFLVDAAASGNQAIATVGAVMGVGFLVVGVGVTVRAGLFSKQG